MDQTVRTEIEEAVGLELSAFGIQGSLAVRGANIDFEGSGAPVSIDIMVELQQWGVLPPLMRTRKAQEVARRIVAAVRAADAAFVPSVAPSATTIPITRYAAIGIAVLLIAAGIKVAGRFLTPAPKAAPVASSEPDTQRSERLARACEAIRDRIYQNAPFSAFPTEGWVVELWLATKTPGLEKHPTITALIDSGKLTSLADEELARVRDGTVDIAPAFDPESKAKAPEWDGVTLVFRDGYARAFFELDGRARFVGLADRVAQGTGVELAALYGRCSHLAWHDVGAWFHGRDPREAAVAVLYEMALFSDSPMLSRASLIAAAPAEGDLGRLTAAVGALSPDALVAAMRAGGGATRTQGGVTITYPFSVPTISIAGTREIAKRVGIGAK